MTAFATGSSFTPNSAFSANSAFSTGSAFAPTLFVPSDDDDLISWWDTLFGVTSDGSDRVSAWTPAAGSVSGDLLQSVNDDKPITNSRTINNKNVLDCDGSQFLRTVDGAFVPTSGNISILMMVAIDSNANAADSIFSIEDTSGKDFQFEADNNSQFDGQINVAGIGSSSAKFANGPFSGNHIMHIVFDFGSSEYIAYVDNVAEISATAYTTKLDAVTTIFGAFSNRTATLQHPDGAIGDIIVTEAIDSTTIGQHYNYLADKYAI